MQVNKSSSIIELSILALDKTNIQDLKFYLNEIIKHLTGLTELKESDRSSLAEVYREIEILLMDYNEELFLSGDDSFDDIRHEEKVQQGIQTLKQFCQQYDQGDSHLSLNKWLIALTHWRIRQSGLINELEFVVNSIAEIANRLREPDDLIDFVGIIQDISLAVTKEYYDDMSNSDPQRPWRVLLLNYAIVATRTHDMNIIESVYQSFVEHLPEDAAQFFTEAMSQMVAQNYPEDVRKVVDGFYQKYTVNQAYNKNVH